MIDFSGRSIGRYQILEKLGEGGMAVVYRAHDSRLDCSVAIKFINLDRLPAEIKQTTLQRFENEAKQMARLTHPNIVKVIDYGRCEEGDIPYFVMEYLPGGSLAGKKVLPYPQVAHLLSKIARALEYAHHQGLIHRDVKPQNILLTESGEPKLSDFGIAKVLNAVDDSAMHLTRTGTTIGTPNYMSMEQWVGQPVPASDQYALGTMMYEMITGRLPYEATTPNELMIKKTSPPIPPRRFAPNLPVPVEGIIMRSIAVNPTDRYPDIGMMAADLERLAAGAYPVGGNRTGTTVVDTRGPGGYAAPVKKKSSSTIWLIVLGAVLLCGLCGIGYAVYSNLPTTMTKTATVTPTIEAPTAVEATSVPSVSGYISDVVMARKVQGAALDPVDPTTTFGPKDIFHAVVQIQDAADGTKFTAVWFAEDVSGVSKEYRIDGTDFVSGGTRNIDFNLTPSGDWPSGTYRVEISINGQMERTIHFKVDGSAAWTEAPPPTSAPKPSTSSYITEVITSKYTEGANLEPVDITSNFGVNDVFHAVAKIENAPNNTKFKAVWYAEDASGVTKDYKIDETDITSSGTRNLDFSLTPQDSWPRGTYRVEIFVNGTWAISAWVTVR